MFGWSIFSERRLPRCMIIVIFLLAFAAGKATMADERPDPQIGKEIAQAVGDAVAELNRFCPLGDPGDQKAFDHCRRMLYGKSRMRQLLSPIILWGRQSADPDASLKDSNLTQLAPDVVTGLYMPLFMFDGKYEVAYNEQNKMYLAKVGATFRNRLKPGEFPYPFWHDPKKWGTYEQANMLLIWIDPTSRKVRSSQVSMRGSAIPGYPGPSVQPPPFDGRWMWTDEQGRTQPVVTLFDGLFSDKNPHKAELEETYRNFATALRDATCLSCHVPSNPFGMKKLVLLQSPAHAASEIKRVLRNVRVHRMPLDDAGIEKTLDPQLEKVLLEKGTEFERVVDAARAWEVTSGVLRQQATDGSLQPQKDDSGKN